MLMTCPRCGFEQPQDQFCANCGLNVETFRMVPQPLLKRITRHPLFFVSVGALLFVILTLFVRSQENAPAPQTESYAQKFPPSTQTAGPNEAPTSESGAKEVNLDTARHADSPSASTLSTAAVATSEEELPEPKTGQDFSTSQAKALQAIAKAPRTPPQMQLQFWEVPVSFISNLSGDTLLEQEALKAIRPTSKEPIQSLSQGVGRRLGSARNLSTQPSTSLSWDIPLAPQVQPAAGLFIDLNVIKIGETDIEVELSGYYQTLASSDQPPETDRFAGRLNLSKTGPVVLARMVAHDRLPDGFSLPTGVLSILGSAEFLRGDSELILVIEPVEANP